MATLLSQQRYSIRAYRGMLERYPWQCMTTLTFPPNTTHVNGSQRLRRYFYRVDGRMNGEGSLASGYISVVNMRNDRIRNAHCLLVGIPQNLLRERAFQRFLTGTWGPHASLTMKTSQENAVSYLARHVYAGEGYQAEIDFFNPETLKHYEQ